MTVKIAALIALLGFSAWGYWLWRKWRDLPHFADTVYEARREQGELGKAITRDMFRQIYTRCEAPRRQTYRFTAALLSTLLLPVSVFSFNRIWDFFWRLAGAPQGPFERGFMLHTFLTFIFVMAVAVGIIYLWLRHFHRHAPPSLKSEIRRLEGDT